MSEPVEIIAPRGGETPQESWRAVLIARLGGEAIVALAEAVNNEPSILQDGDELRVDPLFDGFDDDVGFDKIRIDLTRINCTRESILDFIVDTTVDIADRTGVVEPEILDAQAGRVDLLSDAAAVDFRSLDDVTDEVRSLAQIAASTKGSFDDFSMALFEN